MDRDELQSTRIPCLSRNPSMLRRNHGLPRISSGPFLSPKEKRRNLLAVVLRGVDYPAMVWSLRGHIHWMFSHRRQWQMGGQSPNSFRDYRRNTAADWKATRDLIVDILEINSLPMVAIKIQRDRVLLNADALVLRTPYCRGNPMYVKCPKRHYHASFSIFVSPVRNGNKNPYQVKP